MKRIILLLCISFLGLSISEGQNSRKQGLLEKQIRYFQGLEFQNRGIKGQGIRIAILDGGFPGVDTHEALRHLIDRKQIIATRNFVHGGQNVFTGVAHGTQVLGCIAGIVDGQPLGLAPDAEFLLALTEERGEPLKEEINWAKAVDWAIEQGADIIQSSLGYTYHRYFVKDLDGKTSIAAQAALARCPLRAAAAASLCALAESWAISVSVRRRSLPVRASIPAIIASAAAGSGAGCWAHAPAEHRAVPSTARA